MTFLSGLAFFPVEFPQGNDFQSICLEVVWLKDGHMQRERQEASVSL